MSRHVPVALLVLVVMIRTSGSVVRAEADDPPGPLASAFRPPPEFAGDFGSYKSPLVFDDGRPVRDAADWRKRRGEILKTWRGMIGEWPPLIARPKVEELKSEHRENFTRRGVRVEVAPDRTMDGYLLIPDGKGPFPAVLVVFYEPETAIGRGKERLDFALRLARRGFVTLSIGIDPRRIDTGASPIQIQPLSYLAYVAANGYNALAGVPQVDPKRVGVMGHSYGGKWAMFAACLDDRFACGVWSDPGVALDEARSNVNYWEPWYLGWEPGRSRTPGLPTADNPRTGAYKRLREAGRDLHELQALMAPRPFLVSGGSEDPPERWRALNHAAAVNSLLGAGNRVAMTNRQAHAPTEVSNGQIDAFLEYALKPGAKAAAGPAEMPRSEPGAVGLSAETLAALTPALRKFADDGKIAGGVALVARHGRVAYVSAFGFRDLAARTPMTEDTIFAIASMTKPVTCVAAMTLVEQGKLGLDDPVARYLPELKGLRVLGDAKDDTGTDPATVPAKRPITVRDLMTHTSGLAYGGVLSFDARLGRAYERAGVQGRHLKDLAEQVNRLAGVPLAHQPGERWTYGLSHDVLGRVVEVVSGQKFDTFLRDRIFTPLDMRDTSFHVPEAKRDRVATIYRTGLLGGPLTPIPRNYGSETLFSGGGGLLSTARDYARFAQMLLDGGRLGVVRVLKPETVALMTTNQIGDKTALGFFQYGLGLGLERDRRAVGGKPLAPRYFWGGIFSTNFWVDPGHDVVALILTQVVPTNHGGALTVFRNAVDAAIED